MADTTYAAVKCLPPTPLTVHFGSEADVNERLLSAYFVEKLRRDLLP